VPEENSVVRSLPLAESSQNPLTPQPLRSTSDDPRSGSDILLQGKLGPKASGWLGRMVQKAGEGTPKIGASVAGTVLTKALTKYFGLE
jgi:hypothetical protein